MLALRLVRGAQPAALLRRLLLACAAGGVGFLLLSALGFATAHPGDSGQSLARLVWCLVPLAATVQLAIAVARTETSGRALSGLDAAGMGPARLALLAAASTAVSCLLGSALALLAFLQLRGELRGLPFHGAAADVLAAHRPLPVGAVLVLLCLVPLAAAVGCAIAMRPRSAPPGRAEGPRSAGAGQGAEAGAGPTVAETPPAPVPAGLPWGAALTATGLALEAFASRDEPGEPAVGGLLPLPGTLDGGPPGVIAGWLLTVVGLVLAGPGLTHLCGRLITLGRPGALRLLSGRVLQEDATRIGRPTGVLCAVAAGALAASELFAVAHQEDARLFGPLTVLGAVLVMCCATVSALTAAVESRTARAPATATLLRLGAPRSLLRAAAALRAAVLVAVLTPLAWTVAHLATLPLS